MKYLTLIRSIALLHQHQRERRTVVHDGKRLSYIEVARTDIAIANRLAHEVLGRSLDELAPQTRRLLMLLEEMVSAASARLGVSRTEYRFSRRDVREHTGWTYDQVRVHLDRLVLLEYLLVHHGGRGQSFVYELTYDGKGKDGRPFLVGLLDVELAPDEVSTIGTLGGLNPRFGEPLGAHPGAIGPRVGPSAGERNTNSSARLPNAEAEAGKNADRGERVRRYVLAEARDEAPLPSLAARPPRA
jgi:hypothetical protein